MKRLGNVQFRRADHLRCRKWDAIRDPASAGFSDNQLVPVRLEDCRDDEGVVSFEAIKTAACLPDLKKGANECVTVGPWKERRTGWSVRWTRAVYLVENGVVYTGTERRDNPPVEA